MPNIEKHGSNSSSPDAFSFESLAENLMIKGSVLLGAGLGLYIILKVLGKK